MSHRILFVIYKEFIHIVRDPRTLAVMFLIPVIQLILLGYAVTSDIEHLPTVVLDQDLTPQSRDLIAAYQASNYFDITRYVSSEEELGRLIDKGTHRAGLIIPAGYGRDLEKVGKAQAFFVIDGSDPTVASTAFPAAQIIAQAQSLELAVELIGLDPENLPGIGVHPRIWYNPDMESVNFMIPGLIAMILQFLTTLFTSLSIVREREHGTIEQLMVTPIRPPELILGKVVPYVAIAFFNLAEILVIGVVWFGVPIRGSLALLLALSVIFLLTTLGMGILISTIARTQQEAMYLSFFTLLPALFLGGFLFPLEAMPQVLQWVSYVVPLRYMLVIVRGIVLKGVGLRILAREVIAIAIFGVLIFSVAARRFRKRLE
jgi:ABC-2 type transport system permease protein